MVDPKKIWSSNNLPTLPSVAVRLVEMSKDPNVDMSKVVDVVKTDPAIAAKILKAVNSSYFGLRSEVKSIENAVPLLGTTVVTSLALSFSIAPDSVKCGGLEKHFQIFWLQSIISAVTAEHLGKKYASLGLPCEYFLAGLFADLGRLAILRTIPDDYRAVLDLCEESEEGVRDIEEQLLGFDHVEIGFKLMTEWKLPEAMAQAVQFHESSIDIVMAQEDRGEFELIKAVKLAALVGEFFMSQHKAMVHEQIRSFAETNYGISTEQLDDFLFVIREKMEAAGQMLSVDTSSLPDPSDLIAEANGQLADIALREHVGHSQTTEKFEELESKTRELQAENEHLQTKATRDGLTGLYNREYLMEAFSQSMGRAIRSGKPLGIIFSDVDRFKKLNDTYGHQFGDDVLVGIAKLLQETMRLTDVVARYGGEEIVILAPDIECDELKMITERVRETIASANFNTGQERVRVTVSLGACLVQPNGPIAETDLLEIIRRADKAMYNSKTNGRNRATFTSFDKCTVGEPELTALGSA